MCLSRISLCRIFGVARSETAVPITFIDRTVEDFRDFVLLFVIDDDRRRGILDAVWDRVRVVGLE